MNPTQDGNSLDLSSLLKASQIISNENELEELLKKIIKIFLENTGAQSGFLILETNSELFIEAAATATTEPQILQNIPIEKIEENGEIPLLSTAIVNSVYHSKETLVLPNAMGEGDFTHEDYIQTYKVKSVLCSPLLNQDKVSGIIYLENNLRKDAFTPKNLEILQRLSEQSAIAIDRARLNANLEQKFIEKTQELRQIKTKFQRLVDDIGDKFVIFSHTGVSGIVTYVSGGFESVFGLEKDRIINKPWSESINWLPEDIGKTQMAVMNMIENKIDFDQFEMRFIHPTGERRTVLISRHPVWDEAGNLIAIEGILENITTRQQAEESLRQSEANLRAAQRLAHLGNWSFDVLNHKITLSEETWRIFGLDPHQEAPSYEELVMMIHPDDRAALKQQLEQSLVQKTSYINEFRLIRPSGEIRYIESRGEVILDENDRVNCVFGVSLDITERQQIEIALQERERQYRDLVQAANCIILRWDIDGNIIFLNQYGSEFFDWPIEEMLGKSVIGTIVPEWESSGRDLHTLMQQIYQQPNTFLINENENVCRNGKRVWINWANRPIFNQAGELIEILSIGTDITARKRSEEELAQKNIDLEAAIQAAETANQVKSQFLANMSHELRTPLNAILGFAQVMQRTQQYNPEQFQQESAEHLQIIQNSGNHLLCLINDVLDMSKIEAGKVVLHFDHSDLYSLLRSLEGMFTLKAKEKELTLSFECDPDVPQFIQTDQAKLRQILINLLGNAIKCTPTGSVTLRVWGTENIYFAVEDTGCGIGPEQLEKLFDAFYQAELNRAAQIGTGLGLTITKAYIEMFGGEINVQSTLGQGSRFQFYIPAIAVKNPHSIEVEPSLSVVSVAPNQPNYRILVTEDKWESRVLLVKLLKAVGFEEVREAKNGLEAVEIFESWQPHLIWMDMRMPIMDGYEATQRIRSHLKGQAPAIIALTASALEQEKQIILSIGCDDFVHKPFQEQVIFDKLRQHLGVEYIYQSQSLSNDINKSDDVPQLTPERLSQTPYQWLTQLREAASLADAEWVSQLITQLPSSDADITDVLSHWVKHFRCDQIEELAELASHLSSQ
ncbi:MAG: PAS domain S-box protein [Microcoleaceae cyanobacterium]